VEDGSCIDARRLASTKSAQIGNLLDFGVVGYFTCHPMDLWHQFISSSYALQIVTDGPCLEDSACKKGVEEERQMLWPLSILMVVHVN
jgi:hypothetical protein